MGQQQLLLVILVTIIVGIATVVAINIFGTSADQANQDAVRQDLAQLATSAQGWFIKPEMLGGGGNSFEGLTFNDLSFPAEAISENGTVATNLNGRYEITVDTDDRLVIVAQPTSREFGPDNGDEIGVVIIRSRFATWDAASGQNQGTAEEQLAIEPVVPT